MKHKLILIIAICLVKVCVCEHLIIGDVYNTSIIYRSIEHYVAIPFVKRVKNYFYSNPSQRIIHGILAYDNLDTKATATLTAGGIGYDYVNIRLKSERGKSLDYDITIHS